MSKIKSFEELKALKEQIKSKTDLKEKGIDVDNLIQVRVAMATCGIASGAKEVMDYMSEEFEKQGIKNVEVKQTGCMSYCHSEPTIEVTLPGKEPVIYGKVDKDKAKQIIEEHIKNGKLVDGSIPITYETI